MFPIDRIPPILTLAVFSALTGVLVLIVFRTLSNPSKIRAARSSVIANLLEMRLYNDEPRVVFRAQRDLLWSNLRYFGQLLAPSLLIGLPLVLAYPFLDDLWGRRALTPGSDVVVTATLRDSSATAPKLVATGNALRVTSPGIRIAQPPEVSWRLRAERSGVANLVLQSAASSDAIPVHVGNQQLSSRTRIDPRDPSGAVRSIYIPYPSSGLAALGIELPWELWFVLLSSATAFLLRKRFGVQF